MSDTTSKLRSALPAPLAERASALLGEVAARAEREGLLDVAYAVCDSGAGPLLLAATPTGLVRVAFARDGEDLALEDLALRVSPRILRSPRALDVARRQIGEYFDGRRESFDLKLDWRLARGFRRRVLTATAAIPYGATSSYREVAAGAGNGAAVRAAGTALARNPLPIVVPCHRVLRSDGSLGGYGGGLDVKRFLLDLEAAHAIA